MFYKADIEGMEYSGYIREIPVEPNRYMKFHEGTTEDTYKDVSGRLTCFFTKERETIEWIKTSVNSESVFWDIGANIGQYGIYAACLYGIETLLFEPEAQNFSTLAYNVKLNELKQVVPFPIALSDHQGYNTIKLLTSPGCSNISIEKNYSHQQGVWTDTVDSLVKQGFTSPTHLKIDVDGVELKILKGAVETLPGVKSLLVETDKESIPVVIDFLSRFYFTEPKVYERQVPGVFNLIFER